MLDAVLLPEHSCGWFDIRYPPEHEVDTVVIFSHLLKHPTELANFVVGLNANTWCLPKLWQAHTFARMQTANADVLSDAMEYAKLGGKDELEDEAQSDDSAADEKDSASEQVDVKWTVCDRRNGADGASRSTRGGGGRRGVALDGLSARTSSGACKGALC